MIRITLSAIEPPHELSADARKIWDRRSLAHFIDAGILTLDSLPLVAEWCEQHVTIRRLNAEIMTAMNTKPMDAELVERLAIRHAHLTRRHFEVGSKLPFTPRDRIDLAAGRFPLVAEPPFCDN